jgi:hypothetical protein
MEAAQHGAVVINVEAIAIWDATCYFVLCLLLHNTMSECCLLNDFVQPCIVLLGA